MASLAVLAYVRRKRARETDEHGRHITPISWADWKYTPVTSARAAFFGADQLRLPKVWPISHIEWDDAYENALHIRPSTDDRYGLTRAARLPKIDLSLNNDAFAHRPLAPSLAATDAPADEPSLDNAALPLPMDEADRWSATVEAPQTSMPNEPPSATDGVVVASILTVDQPSSVQTYAPAITESAPPLKDTLEPSREEREVQRPASPSRKAKDTISKPPAAEENRNTSGDAAHQASVAEAKRQLTAGYPAKALATLAPALADARASGDAWTVAGWCWWRTARDSAPHAEDEAEKAVAQTIHAFERAIAVEPDRESALGSALIRCHLFLADLRRGEPRTESLDAALQLMDQATATRRSGDAKFVVEHARALHERALLSGADDRANRLEQAQQLLSGLAPGEADTEAHWLQANLCIAQAQHAQGRAADALLARAVDILASAPADATSELKDGWLTRLIDVELMRVRTLTAAARLMRLRQIRDAYAPRLAQAHSILPLLSWLHLLREWAGMLSEHPAREKLAEAEALFERMESLAPGDIGSMHFARAYYLRLRSAHESIGTALDTLEKADALLAKSLSPVLSPETVSLERAEVALARAPLLDPSERRAALSQAARYADAATAVDDGNLSHALSCALTARLALADISKPSAKETPELADLAWRLLNAAPYEPEAIRLSARGEFAAGNAEIASQLCEMAWDAGCRDTALLRLWRESLSRLPNAAADAANDPQWKRLNQCMRIAQSIGQAAQ